MISQSELDFFIEHNYNVMFIGEKGVGKTAIIKESFERNNLNWVYYSAATMDPWVDFIGVPREQDGFLELIKPKIFSTKVDAIFMDEWNRAPKKVRNATMELIQFKTINGQQLSGIRMIWVAINPDDEDSTYDVEKLDPAQADRFEIKVEIPYKPNIEYFKRKYGETGRYAISWWNELPREIKNEVSPRRLDYSLDIYLNKGNLRYVLPPSANVGKLLRVLERGPAVDKLKNLMNGSSKEIAKFLANENNFEGCISAILKDSKMLSKFVPHMPFEKIALLGNKHEKVAHLITSSLGDERIASIANNIAESGSTTSFAKNLRSHLGKLGKLDVSNTYWREISYKSIGASIISGNLKDEDIIPVTKKIILIIQRTHKTSLCKFQNLYMVCSLLKEKILSLKPTDVNKVKKPWNEVIDTMGYGDLRLPKVISKKK
jgi:hypothetical protein